MCSYESVKTSIRLLLTSASNGLSLEQLNADYQHYNQSKDIPYANFGYTTLFDFVCDMSDIAQLDLNSFPPIVYAITTNHPTKRQIASNEPNVNHNSDVKLKVPVLNNKNFSFEKLNTRSSKNVKRLVLNTLSTNNRQSNPSTEHIIHQLTNLTMNQKSLFKTFSENFHSNEIMTISIDSINQCQIIRYSNGKYYIPCFELSRILNIHENLIDKETMFSRIRIYQSNDLFNKFKTMNHSCQHSRNSHRPYLFFFLISSIIPLLKMTQNINQYYEIVLAFEQLMAM